MSGAGIVHSQTTLPTLTDQQTSMPSLDIQGRVRSFKDAPAVPLCASGSGANSVASAILGAGGSGKTTYVQGFTITGLGATAAGAVIATLGNLIGGIIMNFDVAIPAGVTAGITPIVVNFDTPIAASGPNAGITLSVPAAGAGNTAVHCNIWGFVQ